MKFFNYFIKPELFYRPKSIFKKYLLPEKGIRLVKTIVNEKIIEVDISENIGRCIARFGYYDLCITELLYQIVKPGDFCIDVGANIGYTSIIFSNLVGFNGKVLAFEPNPFLFDRVKKTH